MEEDETIQAKGLANSRRLRIILLADLLVSSITGILLLTKNPGTGGPVVILTLLTLLFMIIFLSSLAALYAIRLKMGAGIFSPLRMLYTSVAISVGAIYLIGLQTLGQVSLIDVVLVIIFELLLNFYLIRRF